MVVPPPAGSSRMVFGKRFPMKTLPKPSITAPDSGKSSEGKHDLGARIETNLRANSNSVDQGRRQQVAASVGMASSEGYFGSPSLGSFRMIAAIELCSLAQAKPSCVIRFHRLRSGNHGLRKTLSPTNTKQSWCVISLFPGDLVLLMHRHQMRPQNGVFRKLRPGRRWLGGAVLKNRRSGARQHRHRPEA